MSRRAFLKALRRLLPPEAIHATEEALRPFECDGLTAYKSLPWLAVLPRDKGQVAEILKLCHRFAVPVVARGAGTGLSGGALPVEEGVLLILSKLNRILAIDTQNRTARVEPGVRNLAISEAAAPYGLHYAPDPSSQIACTIGGNVAENAGGVHCLKYGLTVHNLLGLEVLTVEGETMRIGGETLDTPGYDLLALMTGSEGMLGVVVEATVRLLPKPEAARTVLAAFDDVEEAANAVGEVIASGVLPAGLEMMDNLAIRAAEDYAGVGYPVEAAAILLVEMDGSLEEAEAAMEKVLAVLKGCGAVSLRVAEDERERLRLWAGRKAAFPAMGKLSPDYYCMDGTIPRHRLGEVLKGIEGLSRRFDLPVANVFHAGDGNMHPLILYDAAKGELERAEALGAEILKLCVAVGGTITGEHGVGVEKLDGMCVQFTSQELAQFHAVKAAFDPKGLLNPGKAIPTLHRCAELGAMHVHGGKMPFPELERF